MRTITLLIGLLQTCLLFAQNDTLSGVISQDLLLTNSTTYFLDGKVYIDNGYTLTIEPGTVIKGMQGIGMNASCLIITKGATIDAQGTPSQPIIFTSELDNINCAHPDYPGFSNLGINDKGLWGGLSILGNAPISSVDGNPTTLGEFNNYEYGGNDSSDNSGILQYVQIRHGGTYIGTGNEINLLTLAGVGNQTIVDHIELIAGIDDGLELFGGSVDVSSLLVWGAEDDCVDADQAWGGTLDNFILIQESMTDEALEIEGPENTFIAAPTFTNGTVKGSNFGKIADFKADARGSITNLFFFGFSTPPATTGSFRLDPSTELNFNNGDLFLSDLEIDTNGMSVTMINEIFKNGTDAHAAIVSVPTVGANICEFTGWTCSDNQGILGTEFVINPVGCNDVTAANYCQYATTSVNCRYDPISCGVLDIDESTITFSWSIYPNPAQDHFTLKTANIHPTAHYAIYDILGRKIVEQALTESEEIIETRDWQKGVYCILLTNGNDNYSYRVIKD